MRIRPPKGVTDCHAPAVLAMTSETEGCCLQLSQTRQILWLLTGMIADAGGALTLCEQNTFVRPAELAHNGQAKLCGSCESRPPTGAAATHGNSCNSGMLRMFHKSRKFAICWSCCRIATPPAPANSGGNIPVGGYRHKIQERKRKEKT